MFVMSRKAGQNVVMGPSVELAVVKVSGNRVLLGISTPREILIRRSHKVAPQPKPRRCIRQVREMMDPPSAVVGAESGWKQQQYEPVNSDQTSPLPSEVARFTRRCASSRSYPPTELRDYPPAELPLEESPTD